MSILIGVVGAGTWGTALATVLGNTVLYTHKPDQAKLLRETHRTDCLPGCTIPDTVKITADIDDLSSVDILLMVCPVNATRGVLQQLDLPETVPIIHCAKGLEKGTQKCMTEVGQDILPNNPHGVLSGPSFAVDVVNGKPTAVTLAFSERNLAEEVQSHLHRPTFRPYISTDIIGVQLGGALKNVIAIACGICKAQQLGESACAGLIARGFAEMQRVGVALGGQAETFAGLSGLGDLVLTCSSAQSRNFSYGLAIGRGDTPDAGKLAEGAKSAQVLLKLAQKHNLDMPICDAVAHILDGTLSISKAIDKLLQRPLGKE